jgi:hypothetical protein
MSDDLLDTVKAALLKVPGLVWLSESGTGWCDDDENAAIMAVLTAAPALVDRAEQAEAALAAARAELAEANEMCVSAYGTTASEVLEENGRLKNELERQGQQDTHISTLMRELAEARATRDQALQSAHEAAHTIGNLTDEVEQLRRWLWATHGCPVAVLYGDDGEMQCNATAIHRPLDFKRDDLIRLVVAANNGCERAEVEREQRCETCQHREDGPRVSFRNVVYEGPFCQKAGRTEDEDTPNDDDGNPIVVRCTTLGNGCRAWARREP